MILLPVFTLAVKMGLAHIMYRIGMASKFMGYNENENKVYNMG